MNLEKILQEEYKDVSNQTRKEIKQVAHSKEVDDIQKVYKYFMRTCKKIFDDANDINRTTENVKFLATNENLYFLAKRLTEKLDFEKKDLDTFFSELVNYKKFVSFSSTGFFISALINKNYDRTRMREEYVLIAYDLDELGYIGSHCNGANIHVYGNVGSQICEKMEKGTVTIEGNAGYCAGCNMKGGTLILQNADNELGAFMNGGTIICKNAGEEVGLFMIRGTIHITEFCKEISESYYGGDIYYRGEKISPKEMKIK